MDQKSSTKLKIAQNSCRTLMKGRDPLQMLTTVYRRKQSQFFYNIEA